MKKLLIMLLCCALTLGLCSLALAEDVPATEGVGTSYTFRLNGTNTSFYNVAFSRVKLDAEGKIVDNYEDVLEIADPTVGMASCPRYAVVGDTMNWNDLTAGETKATEITTEAAQELVAAWRTKHERGTEYGMGGAGE